MAEQQESQQHGFVPQTEYSAPKPPPKRLILCCDGTWQASDHGTQEIPSNITKLSLAIAKTFVNSDNQAVPQIVHYDAGVATADWIDGKVSGEIDFIHNSSRRALPSSLVFRLSSALTTRVVVFSYSPQSFLRVFCCCEQKLLHYPGSLQTLRCRKYFSEISFHGRRA